MWDDAHNRMVIFGGTTTPAYTLSSTVYTYVDSAYGLFAPGLIHASGTAPSARTFSSAIYDSLGQRMIVFGGTDSLSGSSDNDVWSLDLSTSPPAWTKLAPPATHVAAFTMSAPSPNPARSSTRIAFTLGHDARVRAEVFDVSGHRVNTLIDGVEAAGEHTLEWSGHDANGGSVRARLYLCRLSAGDQSLTQKIMWVR